VREMIAIMRPEGTTEIKAREEVKSEAEVQPGKLI
jgi:hypothetical protein